MVKPWSIGVVVLLGALLALGTPIGEYAAFGAVLLAGFACAAWLVGAQEFAKILIGPLFGCVLVTLLAGPARLAVVEFLSDTRVRAALGVAVLVLLLAGCVLLYAKLRGAGGSHKPAGKLPLRERAVLVDPIRPDQVLAGQSGRGRAATETRRPDPLAAPGGLGRDDDLGLFGRRRT